MVGWVMLEARRAVPRLCVRRHFQAVGDGLAQWLGMTTRSGPTVLV
jgi:hypothetical protein